MGFRYSTKRLSIVLCFLLLLIACSSIILAQDQQVDEDLIERLKSDPNILWVEKKARNKSEALQIAERAFNERVVNKYQLLKQSQVILSKIEFETELVLEGRSLIQPIPSKSYVRKSRRNWIAFVYKELNLVEADLSDRVVNNLMQLNGGLKIAFAPSPQSATATEQAKIKLVNSLGSLTKASQEMELSEDNGVITERFSSSVSQQRMLQIQGIKTFSFQWSTNQIVGFAYISEKDLQDGDRQLSDRINTYYQEAMRLRNQGSYALALENLYKAYLTSLIAYKPIQLSSQDGRKSDASIQILNQYRELFTEAVDFQARPGYLLNDETVTFPLSVKIKGEDSPDFYVRYKDGGEEVIIKARFGRGKLNLYKPRSEYSSLQFALEISPSLSNQTRSDQMLNVLEKEFKLWLTKAVDLDLSVVQSLTLNSKYISSNRSISLEPKTQFLELNQLSWVYGEHDYIGQNWTIPVSWVDIRKELVLTPNGNTQDQRYYRIDPQNFTLTELKKPKNKQQDSSSPQKNKPDDDKFIQKVEQVNKDLSEEVDIPSSTIRAKSLSSTFPNELNAITRIQKTDILLNVLNSYRRSGWTIGNASNIPTSEAFLLILADRSDVLDYIYVNGKEVINHKNEIVPMPEAKADQIIIWMKK